MVMDNICTLLNNFLKCSAYENIIFCWVMYEQGIIDEILSRLNIAECQVIAVSFVCTEECLIERLQKDVDKGLRSVDVIERSVKRLPLYQKLNTIKLDTIGKMLEDIVKEIVGLK